MTPLDQVPWTLSHDGHGGVYIGDADGRQVGYVSAGPKQESRALLISESPVMAALLDEVTALAELFRNRLGHDVNDYPTIAEARTLLSRLGRGK